MPDYEARGSGALATSPWVLWCFRGTMALSCFLMTIAAPWLRAPSTAHLASSIPPFDVTPDKTLLLLPLGQLQERDVDFIARAIEARTGVHVEILPPRALPAGVFDFPSSSYDANAVLDWLFLTRQPGEWRTLALTRDALSTYDTDHLYGLANLREGVAVVSLHGFLDGLRDADPMRRAAAQDQIGRIAFHELVHTLGVEHCPAKGCLMSGITDKSQIHPGTRTCERCIHAIQDTLSTPRTPWLEVIARGDGFYRRGLYGQALGAYRRASAAMAPTEADRPAGPSHAALSDAISSDALPSHAAPSDAPPSDASPSDAPPSDRRPDSDRRFDSDASGRRSVVDRAEVENRIGAALFSLDRVAEAERHVRRAIALDPALSAAHFNMALILAYAGEEAEALHTLDRSLDLEPDRLTRHELTARFHLAAIDDPGNALLALRRYRDAGGDDPDLLGALIALQSANFIVFEPSEVEIIEGHLRP